MKLNSRVKGARNATGSGGTGDGLVLAGPHEFTASAGQSRGSPIDAGFSKIDVDAGSEDSNNVLHVGDRTNLNSRRRRRRGSCSQPSIEKSEESEGRLEHHLVGRRVVNFGLGYNLEFC